MTLKSASEFGRVPHCFLSSMANARYQLSGLLCVGKISRSCFVDDQGHLKVSKIKNLFKTGFQQLIIGLKPIFNNR